MSRDIDGGEDIVGDDTVAGMTDVVEIGVRATGVDVDDTEGEPGSSVEGEERLEDANGEEGDLELFSKK